MTSSQSSQSGEKTCVGFDCSEQVCGMHGNTPDERGGRPCAANHASQRICATGRGLIKQRRWKSVILDQNAQL